MRKKDMIELGATVVLGLILLVASLSLVQKTKNRAVSRPVPPASAAVSQPVSGVHAAVPRAKGVSYGPKLHRKKVHGEKFINRFNVVTAALPLERDPFGVGQTASQDAKVSPPLNGILWDEASPTAVVGSDFLKEGDTFDRFKVVKIHPTKVVFQEGDTQFEVSLNQNS